MITLKQFQSDPSLPFLLDVGRAAAIVITEPVLLNRCRDALKAGDTTLDTVPLGSWVMRGEGERTAITAALRERGAEWSPELGAAVFKAVALAAISEPQGCQGPE